MNEEIENGYLKGLVAYIVTLVLILVGVSIQASVEYKDPLMDATQSSGGILTNIAAIIGLVALVGYCYSMFKMINQSKWRYGHSGFKLISTSLVLPALLMYFVDEITITMTDQLGHMFSMMTFGFSLLIFIGVWMIGSKPTPQTKYDSGKGGIDTAGSKLNPKNLLSGSRWTTPRELATYLKPAQNKVYINNFRYYGDTKQALAKGKLSTAAIANNEKTPVYFDLIKMCETLVFIGGMGSGKSHAISAIMTQPFWKRQVIHDPQGEFRKMLVPADGSSNDIIYSPYDKAGWIWDIFADMDAHGDAIAYAYASELFSAVIKQTNDSFWSERGTQIVGDIIVEVWMSEAITGTRDKYMALAQAIKLKSQKMSDNGGTEGSLGQTMLAIVDSLYYTAWKASIDGTKFFTITEFFKNQSGQKIILANSTKYKKKLSPLFAGFVGVLVSIANSLPNIDRNAEYPDISLFVLDEVFKLGMSENAMDELCTLGRKKGLAVILAAQALPTDNPAILKIVESSAYAQFIFRLTHKDTLERILKSFDEVEFTKEEHSVSASTSKNQGASPNVGQAGLFAPVALAGSMLPSGSNTSTSTSVSIREKKEKFLTVDDINNMPEYHSLVIMRGITYLGQVDSAYFNGLPTIGVEEDLVDTKDFYKFRRELDGVQPNSSDDEDIVEEIVNLEEVQSDG